MFFFAVQKRTQKTHPKTPPDRTGRDVQPVFGKQVRLRFGATVASAFGILLRPSNQFECKNV